MPVVEFAAHRLVLSGAEFALLAERAETTIPSWFGIGDSDTAEGQHEPSAPQTRLQEIGALDAAGTPVASVAANLAVLTAPVVTVRTEVSVRDQGLISVHTVSGQLGASLISLEGGAVELTMFPAALLGAELRRAVPPLPAEGGNDLEDAFGAPPALSGWLPLTALREFSAVTALAGRAGVEQLVEEEGMSSAQTVLAREVTQRTRGVLQSLIVGRAAGQTGVGQLVWLATNTGWVGLRPQSVAGRRLVDLVPVAPADYPSWLAADLATILDSAL